uniref:ABC transporter domain-containing protein n=1 Tax=Physcomitrium patens TaxID=3218 RepID=A0A2K1IJE0_PHYPA|nr:hypothetical protein PHYPA_028086 [Physcomitrium patens]
MDVLAGKEKQETFARISGCCEQNDIRSPQLDVRELLGYAWLRLDPDISNEDKLKFVDQVMELMELSLVEHALVGLPGTSRLSTEQRKHQTIAAELVVNPSIIFMDEPTRGLDARSAAIPGVTKIKEGYNPATWMLEVTNNRIEDQLGVNFAELSLASDLYKFVFFQTCSATVSNNQSVFSIYIYIYIYI